MKPPRSRRRIAAAVVLVLFGLSTVGAGALALSSVVTPLAAREPEVLTEEHYAADLGARTMVEGARRMVSALSLALLAMGSASLAGAAVVLWRRAPSP